MWRMVVAGAVVACIGEGVHAAPRRAVSFDGGDRVVAVVDEIAPPRVRSHSQVIRDAIEEGTRRSSTFRSLVERIRSSDGLVYVDEGACRASARACLTSVAVAGQYRVVMIVVNRRRAPGCELVAAIGHELQHAVEVLSHPAVKDAQDLFHLFHRIGPSAGGRFETEAAMEAGLAVAREACRD